MATLAQILPRKFPTKPFTSIGSSDVYSSIVWNASEPLPTEAEIRAFSATVDAEIAADTAKQRQQEKLLSLSTQPLIEFAAALVLQLQEIRDNDGDLTQADWTGLSALETMLTEATS